MPRPARFIPLAYTAPADEDLRARARSFCESSATRRTVRAFSDCAVPREPSNGACGLGTDASKPFLLLVVGYPAKNAVVPDIRRKDLADITSWTC